MEQRVNSHFVNFTEKPLVDAQAGFTPTEQFHRIQLNKANLKASHNWQFSWSKRILNQISGSIFGSSWSTGLKSRVYRINKWSRSLTLYFYAGIFAALWVSYSMQFAAGVELSREINCDVEIENETMAHGLSRALLTS